MTSKVRDIGLTKTAQGLGSVIGRGVLTGDRLLARGLAGLGTLSSRGLSALEKGLGKLGLKINRFGELVLGGKESTLRDYNELQRFLTQSIDNAKRTGGDPERFRRLKDSLREAFVSGNGQVVNIPSVDPSTGAAITKAVTATPEVADELGKVYGARALSVLGLGGAGYAGYSLSKKRKRSLMDKILDKVAEARPLPRMAKAAALDKATPETEYAAGLPTETMMSLLPGGGTLTSLPYLIGLMSKEDNSQRDLNGMSFVPGMSAFSRGNRIKTQIKRELRDIESDSRHKGSRPVAHAIAEHLGPLTSILASAGIGAGIGAALPAKKRGKSRRNHAIAGGLLGAGVGSMGHLASIIAAAVNRRRTKEEQIEADKGSLAAKYLVPGMAQYGRYKRLGRSQGERDEDPKNAKHDRNGKNDK